MAKCDRTDVPKLIGEIDRLKIEVSLQKAMRSIAERKLEALQGRYAGPTPASRKRPYRNAANGNANSRSATRA